MRRDPAETDRVTLEALAASVARPVGRILVVADFDGTLAEINADPLAARPVPGALRALRRLARIGTDRPGRLAIAVLTGRAVADIAGRVRVGGMRYLGNHGLEAGWLPRGQRAERIVTTGSRD
ncbi:MAG: trehalose-phosphatase, partial [Candidatus Limnocylindrales bacterium]